MELHVIEREGREIVVLLDNDMRKEIALDYR